MVGVRVIRPIIWAPRWRPLYQTLQKHAMPIVMAASHSYPRTGADESGGGGGKHRRGWLAIALAPMQPLCLAVGVRACAFD